MAAVSMLPVGAEHPSGAIGFVAEQCDDENVHAILVMSFVNGQSDNRVFGDVRRADLVYALERLKLFVVGEKDVDDG